MSKIKNLNMKGKQLVTSFGIVQFDADGIADFPEDRVQEFLSIQGFEPAENTLNFDRKLEENPPLVNSLTTEENPQEDSENAQDETPEEAPDFDKMSVPQLKKYAKDHNIDLMGANKKDEIIPLIVGSDK